MRSRMKKKADKAHCPFDCTTAWATILRVFSTMNLTFLFKRFFPSLLLLCGLLLTSCSGPGFTPSITPTSLATGTPTPTIVWFPPTDTPTLFPSLPPAPTEDYHPGLGDMIFTDSFTQPALWDNVSSAQASATLARNRLLLSINGPGPVRVISLRSQPVLGDFYAEATVDISLCSGMDQYGMIFRATSRNDYYRFVVNCSGQARLERLRGGETYPLLDWLSSGDAPFGAPAQLKIGVWAAGRELRVFLNDHFQFSQSDPVFSNGAIGFFIYANGETPVTVSFSNLSVYSIFYISPTPPLTPTITSIPTRNPTP